MVKTNTRHLLCYGLYQHKIAHLVGGDANERRNSTRQMNKIENEIYLKTQTGLVA